jgi:hypothetical protein
MMNRRSFKGFLARLPLIGHLFSREPEVMSEEDWKEFEDHIKKYLVANRFTTKDWIGLDRAVLTAARERLRGLDQVKNL